MEAALYFLSPVQDESQRGWKDLPGSLSGDVDSQGSVVIRSGARVAGNMSGSEVSLEEGAAFSGRIEADFELPDGLAAGDGPAGRRGR
jgi:hypothetical protein